MMKRIFSTLIIGIMLVALSACVSLEPCISCGDTPTKEYLNTYFDEKEYYCADCSSDCVFCSDEATEYYTSGLGEIFFVCKDCYEEIQELNS